MLARAEKARGKSMTEGKKNNEKKKRRASPGDDDDDDADADDK